MIRPEAYVASTPLSITWQRYWGMGYRSNCQHIALCGSRPAKPAEIGNIHVTRAWWRCMSLGPAIGLRPEEAYYWRSRPGASCTASCSAPLRLSHLAKLQLGICGSAAATCRHQSRRLTLVLKRFPNSHSSFALLDDKTTLVSTPLELDCFREHLALDV